ncbi:ATP-binding cassette domain-containing protein, partial [Bacteroidales bacterium OttesenSCG-928-J19]|nr:ATP-binding cassette domain-containing protein [Bacteroidales bacterium OttesenSCG-928-J19]
MTEKPYLSIENLSITYPEGKGIKDISLNIEQNTVTAIMGTQGCGKTTLLKSINRMHERHQDIKESGNIYWNGKNIRDINILSLRKNIGIVFREPVMFPNMNIYQNILIGYKLNHIS